MGINFLPLVIFAGIQMLGTGMHLAKHGEQMSDQKYNFWSALIVDVTTFGLIYWAMIPVL